ncbi:ROK family protein [Gynurincola endophyticus]|uniref:ROK family protein n=1 Tax=Gynurincola endophyticus TaxID=2479004 RepID=UPI000F8D4DF7|nr:ROK family protein [Gynurincola endophyticus]
MSMNHWVLGVDIGGTHISCCLVDMANNRVHEKSFARAAVRSNEKMQIIFGDWLKAIKKSLSFVNANVQIGIAMPGPFDYEKGICWMKDLHKYDALYGIDVKEMLSILLDLVPGKIRFINDASAYLLGEVYFGVARGEQNVVGVTLGTGLGSAQWRNGKMIEGDLWCTPFAEGTAEDYMAARWLVHQYYARTGTLLDGVKDMAAEETPMVDEIFQMYGENLAKIILQRYHNALPDVVVVGGNISKAWNRFIPHTHAYFQSKGENIQCVQAVLGEQAALLGAASLFTKEKVR